jgi:hypothetical protein
MSYVLLASTFETSKHFHITLLGLVKVCARANH